MIDWRERAIRHSIETESLFVVDHWRVWARTRDGNNELRDITHDADAGDMLHEAIHDAIQKLGRVLFPGEDSYG